MLKTERMRFMKSTKRVYIAYGSNMSKEQMEYRCPAARVLGTGFLTGYELNFCGNKNGRNFASVIKKAGAETPVVLWETTSSDERRLDCYEGFPSFYRKEMIQRDMLKIADISTAFDEAYIYIMNSEYFGIPSNDYFTGIYFAYKDFGIDTKYLEDALIRSSH